MIAGELASVSSSSLDGGRCSLETLASSPEPRHCRTLATWLASCSVMQPGAVRQFVAGTARGYGQFAGGTVAQFASSPAVASSSSPVRQFAGDDHCSLAQFASSPAVASSSSPVRQFVAGTARGYGQFAGELETLAQFAGGTVARQDVASLEQFAGDRGRDVLQRRQTVASQATQ